MVSTKGFAERQGHRVTGALGDRGTGRQADSGTATGTATGTGRQALGVRHWATGTGTGRQALGDSEGNFGKEMETMSGASMRRCGAATCNDGVVQLQETTVWCSYRQQWCGTATFNNGVVQCGTATCNDGVVQLQATTVWCSYRQQWCGTATFNNGVVHSWGYVYLQWWGTRLGLRLLM